MVTKETKIQLTDKINNLFKVMFSLIGIIGCNAISNTWYSVLLGFFLGGVVGNIMRPYNKTGDYRY